MEKPLPCPICGRPPQTSAARWAGERSTVRCVPCDLTMGSRGNETPGGVIHRWNQRAPLPQKDPT